VTEDQLAKLNTTSVDEICVAQKLCKEGRLLASFLTDFPGEIVDLEKLSEGVQPPAQQADEEFEAIPDVEGAADAHSADDPKDTIRNAYAK
jgi:cytochrome c1